MEATEEYRYYRDALAGRALPALVLDRDRLDENIRAVSARAGDRPVRAASKSIRSTAVLRRILDADPRFRGVLCYSADEAAWLAGQGFDDLVVAYPTVQPGSVRAVCEAVGRGSSITLMVDDAEQVRRLDSLAGEAGVVLPVAIDVDMSVRFPGLYFGVRRSPLSEASQVLALYREIARRDHVRLDGVMGYEAQISGVGDTVPGKVVQNRLVRWLKSRSVPKIAARREAAVAALRDAGAELRFVNGGGTGSLESTSRESAVTEVTAGSALYAPRLFDHYRAFRHRPALMFALEVVRRPAAGVVTCQGGGYIASGSGGAGVLPEPWLPGGLSLNAVEGAGEVQTPLHGAPGDLPGLGEPVFFRHAKSGEVCERFREILVVAGGRVEETVNTYRGDGQCFF